MEPHRRVCPSCEKPITGASAEWQRTDSGERTFTHRDQECLKKFFCPDGVWIFVG